MIINMSEINTKIRYGCGHTSDGVLILDSNELLIMAYEDWVNSVGLFGDKTKCWNCYCKESEKK